MLEIIYKTESFHKYEIVKVYIDIRIGNIFLLPILLKKYPLNKLFHLFLLLLEFVIFVII